MRLPQILLHTNERQDLDNGVFINLKSEQKCFCKTTLLVSYILFITDKFSTKTSFISPPEKNLFLPFHTTVHSASISNHGFYCLFLYQTKYLGYSLPCQLHTLLDIMLNMSFVSFLLTINTLI
jgi:hypothetical protein